MNLALVLLTGTLAVAQAEAPAVKQNAANEAQLKAEVRQLVRQLVDPQLEVRDSAEKALRDKGVAVLSHLPVLNERMPAEMRRRLESVIKHLEEIQATRATSAGLVTLQVTDEPLSKVVAMLEEQTGNKIVDFRAFRRQPMTDPKLTIDLVEVPFWRAMDEVLDAAGLTTYPYAIDDEGRPLRAVAMVASDDEFPSRTELAVYNGPFRFQPQEILARRGLADPASSALEIKVQATWEPRLSPITLNLLNESLTAKLDTGATLKSAARGNTPIQVRSQITDFRLQYQLPEPQATKITELKGTLAGLIPGRLAKFEFSDLAAEKKQVKKQAGATVRLDDVRKNRDIWEVRVIVQFENAAGSLESHLMGWVLENEAFLMTPDGEKVEAATIEKTREWEDEFGVAYLFGIEGDLDDHRFVYKTPAALVEKEIPFIFENLPLP